MLTTEHMQRCTLNDCQAACCLHGAWVDLTEIEDIQANAEIIKPHLSPEVCQPQDWFDERKEPDEFSISGIVGHTAIILNPDHYGGIACIFLRADSKCALQTAALEADLHPWRFKPFYCILHPLMLDSQGRITLDETQILLNEPASCLRPSEHSIPLIKTFAEELRYFLGEKDYCQLKTGD